MSSLLWTGRKNASSCEFELFRSWLGVKKAILRLAKNASPLESTEEIVGIPDDY